MERELKDDIIYPIDWDHLKSQVLPLLLRNSPPYEKRSRRLPSSHYHRREGGVLWHGTFDAEHMPPRTYAFTPIRVARLIIAPEGPFCLLSVILQESAKAKAWCGKRTSPTRVNFTERRIIPTADHANSI